MREAATGANPINISVTGNKIVNFKVYGRDDAKPVVDVTAPLASGSTAITTPLSAKCTVEEKGDDTDNDGVADRPKAGIGQVSMGLGRNPQQLFPGSTTFIPAQLFNFVTQRWENTPSSIVDGFSPTNFALARFLKPAVASNGSWKIPLPQTDADGNPVFVSGTSYMILAGAVDKAGNGGYDKLPGVFEIQ